MNDFWKDFKSFKDPHDSCFCSAHTFFIVINSKNKTNMKVAASNMNIEIHEPILGVHVTIVNWFELVLEQCAGHTCEKNHKVNLDILSNLFFNSFMNMKTKNKLHFFFHFFWWRWKMKKSIKKSIKNLLNKKILFNYLNFVFHIVVKTKSKCEIFFFLEFIKNTKWNFGYMDCGHIDWLLKWGEVSV